MSEILKLVAEKREVTGRKTNQLREQGIVPATIYGFEMESTSIQIQNSDFIRLYRKTGMSTIFNVELDGVEHPVLVQDIQHDPVTEDVIHVDFRRVDMSQKIEAAVKILLEGIAPAVKDLGGNLVQSLEEVDVLSNPMSLVRELVIDVSGLNTFDDVLRVSDIKVPDGIEILTDIERTVAVVQAPRAQEEDEVVAESGEGGGTSERGEKEDGEKKEGDDEQNQESSESNE